MNFVITVKNKIKMNDGEMMKFTKYCRSVILDINNYQMNLLQELIEFDNDVKKLDDKRKYLISFIENLIEDNIISKHDEKLWDYILIFFFFADEIVSNRNGEHIYIPKEDPKPIRNLQPIHLNMDLSNTDFRNHPNNSQDQIIFQTNNTSQNQITYQTNTPQNQIMKF